MASFIFMRHGKSQDNHDDVVSTVNTPLTRQGKAQASQAGRTLKDVGISALFCSPYPRARQTATIIAKQIGLNPDAIVVLDELREKSLGSLEGSPHHHERTWYFTVDGQDGVEPMADLFARCRVALQRIAQASQDGKVLVVGHVMAGFYLQQIAQGKYRLQDCDPPVIFANAEPIEVTIHSPSVKQRTRLHFTRLQLSVIGLAAIATVSVAVLFGLAQISQSPQQTRGGLLPAIPLQPGDFSGESANLQGVIQKQLQQTGHSNQHPQDNTANLLQPVQGLQMPKQKE